MTLLSEQLQQFKSTFDADTPPKILETINRSVSLFQSQNQLNNCLKIDETFPAFELIGVNGESFNSRELVLDKPLIITFIRGGWCPYCMLEMQAWQTYFEQHNEQLNIVAITPESPAYANTMQQDNNLSLPLVFDAEMAFANELGLAWHIDEELKQLLLKWNIDVSERTCNDSFDLPVPATFVIDQNHQIKFRFIEEDYSIRAEPEQVIKVYQMLK